MSKNIMSKNIMSKNIHHIILFALIAAKKEKNMMLIQKIRQKLQRKKKRKINQNMSFLDHLNVGYIYIQFSY